MAFFSSFFVSLFFLIICLSITIAQAKEYLVGGYTDAWAVPASSSYTLNKWSEANRFQVGDSLGNKPYFSSSLAFIHPLFFFFHLSRFEEHHDSTLPLISGPINSTLPLQCGTMTRRKTQCFVSQEKHI